MCAMSATTMAKELLWIFKNIVNQIMLVWLKTVQRWNICEYYNHDMYLACVHTKELLCIDLWYFGKYDFNFCVGTSMECMYVVK